MPELLSEHLNILVIAACILSAVSIVLLIVLLVKQHHSYKAFSDNLEDANKQSAELEEKLRSELSRQQQAFISTVTENSRTSDQRMDMLSARLDIFDQSQDIRIHRIVSTLDNKLTSNDEKTEQLRTTLASGIEKLQKENSEKLEQMRVTVDEKLHETLNKRLGESFSVVNERLEQVYKGLGEMQTLANGVCDLKRVLTNVKTRGIWGEIQLGNLISQIMTSEQYEENVQIVPGSPERVEFAIRLPGTDTNQPVYLPIDSKFPMEAYERLQNASEAGDAEALAAATQQLQTAIRNEAKRISKKYIAPPHSTDFAVMFLATEGLYAEAMRSRGLMEEIQREQRVLIAGPSTLSALLNSLQVGFRTLAIEQRSADVWLLLGSVKAEFGRFAELLDQTQQRLRQAGETIEKAAARTRAINRRLREVDTLGTPQNNGLISDDQPGRLPEE
ncbi:MAG: DNA recombination protein RmuC [Clostridia bacterium]|nr:DNA recombination protein RmuC [Clostridia bacterium]